MSNNLSYTPYYKSSPQQQPSPQYEKTSNGSLNGVEIIRLNKNFKLNCDQLQKQSESVFVNLKNTEFNITNIKQTMVDVKQLETKISELYNILNSEYQSILLGKDIQKSPQSTFSITPLDINNTKISELRVSDKKISTSAFPLSATNATSNYSDKKIPIIGEGSDIKIVLNEVKGTTSQHSNVNYDKLYKTQADEEQDNQEELRQKFLSMNGEDDNLQLLNLPGDIRQKPSSSPKKMSFDVGDYKNVYKSSDEIERLIQQYKNQSMSKSVNHEVISEAIDESSTSNRQKPNVRGNSISYSKDEDNQQNNTQNTQVNNINLEKIKNETADQNTPSKRSLKTTVNAGSGENTPGGSKKHQTQELLDRVNNMLQRSDLFLQKHSEKKLKKEPSVKYSSAAADEKTIQQQKSEYDQSSEIKAIMESIKRRQQNNKVVDTVIENTKINLNDKFSEQSPTGKSKSPVVKACSSGKGSPTNSKSPKNKLTGSDLKNSTSFTSSQNHAMKKSYDNSPSSIKAVYGNNTETNVSNEGKNQSEFQFSHVRQGSSSVNNSPKNFKLSNTSQGFKSPQIKPQSNFSNSIGQDSPKSQKNSSDNNSNSTTDKKKENLSSFARNVVGDSGILSPSSIASNQSTAVKVVVNKTENAKDEEQPNIPVLKETVSNEQNIIQLKQAQSVINQPLYDELDPFNYSVDNFKIGKKLGSGKFADVYAAVDKHNGFRVALKQIKKDTIKEFNLYQDILNEIKFQSILHHPNIIQLYGFFIDNDSIYLIQELAIGKELFTELKQTHYKQFTESQTSFYVKQVIEALIYMHSKNVVHRDLKPENIMVYGGLLKLCDFGYAAKVEKNKMRNTFCGTLDYVSPEMVQRKSYDFSVDVWSVGILTYELIIGYAPFAGKNNDATFDQIVNGELRFSGPISFEGGDFISKILERDPKKRMNLAEALKHPFIQNEYIKRLQNEQGGQIEFSDMLKL